MSIAVQVASSWADSSVPLVEQLVNTRFASRLFAKDATLWGEAAEQDTSTRLGWVDPFARTTELIAQANSIRDTLRAGGIDRIVLCGMGGSSLGPQVVAREAGVDLTVLDSTHPAEVARALAGDLDRTAVVVSSKSGTTLETNLHAAMFIDAFSRAGIEPAERVLFVTDPGSQLAQKAEEGFQVVLADPNVGGRFSVLTAFGILPAVLAGADFDRLIAEAATAASALAIDSTDNPALRLAAVLAAAHPTRFALLLQESASESWGLGDWIEQLIAESTGKQGKGILPIALEPDDCRLRRSLGSALLATVGDKPGDPRADITVLAPLGAQFLLWEVATAALGHLLRINPFDQPNVEAAKAAARECLHTGAAAPDAAQIPDADPDELIPLLRGALSPDGYVAIQAFVDRESNSALAAKRLLERLSTELDVPVSIGWGPRYLHSVGQFHKGGPRVGVFVQLFDDALPELTALAHGVSLASVLRAQADGDHQVLEAQGRPVLRRSC